MPRPSKKPPIVTYSMLSTQVRLLSRDGKHRAGKCACLGVKNIGKPCAGKLHARFDEGGQAKGCSLLYPLIYVATHILAAEGDSKWSFFDGNYQEYEADKKKRLGEEGAKPKRIRYKPISR